MAKKLIETLMRRLNMVPNKDNIAQNKSLQFLGEKLHQPHLWHINRHSVARAFAVGGFAMYTPPLPWQMLIAAVLAVYFEANLPISVALVWITNPLTWIPLYYIAYSAGAWLLGKENYSFDDFSTVFSSLGDAWEKLGAPFLVGCFVMMVLCAIVGYFGIQAFWRYHVMQAWERRKQTRRDGIRRTFESLPSEEGGQAVDQPYAALQFDWQHTFKACAKVVGDGVGVVAVAARVGGQMFMRQAGDAWTAYRRQKQVATAAKEPSLEAENSAAAAVGANGGTPGLEFDELLGIVWQDYAKPMAIDAYRLAIIALVAGYAGVGAFLQHLPIAWERR